MAGHTLIAVASPAVLFFSHLFPIFSPVLPPAAHASFLLFHNQISARIAPEAAKAGLGEGVWVEKRASSFNEIINV